MAAARRRGGSSLQDAARRARLGVLGALAAERGARRVALGHQADDQAETVLQRIVRGTGLVGLRGIPYPARPSCGRCSTSGGGTSFVTFAGAASRSWRTRPTPTRGFPGRPDPPPGIAPARRGESPGGRGADRARRGGPRRPRHPGGGRAPGRDPARGRGRRSPPVAGGHRGGSRGGRTEGGGLVRPGARPGTPARSQESIGAETGDGTGAGPGDGRPSRLVSAGRRWARSRCAIDGVAARKRDERAFDADRLGWPLLLRARRPGDRMRPRGGRGSRKLSDLMIDAKIARGARAELPVLTTSGGEVLYVPGLRPAELARPTPATRRVLRVDFAQIPAGGVSGGGSGGAKGREEV